MTHLLKPGFTPQPYRAKTACGLVASAFDVVESSPDCPECVEAELQQLVNDEAELDALLAEVA